MTVVNERALDPGATSRGLTHGRVLPDGSIRVVSGTLSCESTLMDGTGSQ